MGLYWDNGKENGNYRDYKAFIGVIQGMYWGYFGIMEKKMETIITGYIYGLYYKGIFVFVSFTW